MGFLKHANPYLAMIFVQVGFAGSAIIAKSALNQGMSHYALSIYRNLIAAVAFAPFAVVLERKVRPRMTFSVLWKILLLGLLEPVIDQNLYYAAMKYTTATFTAAMTNMVPALTFLLAWILRLEQVNLRRIHGLVKIAGTAVTVGGAMIMTLVKGPTIGLPWTKADTGVHSSTVANPQDPIKGALMLAAGCFCWANFYNLQAITLKSYPAGLSLTSMICMAGALQAIVVTLVAERGNSSIWSIHFDTILLCYVYCGLINSGVTYYVTGLILRSKGPVFVAAFNPLSMVIVAIMSSFILSEQLNFGRVFGAVIIMLGLYLVIWGKSKDKCLSSKSNNIDRIAPIDQQLPDKNLPTKSSINIDEKSEANIAGDNAA
ncbi:WAT1-related protein At2g39510 [Coffea arabica]|uniref:WAT1-related protein n=1 Tax=Coffea arabica TaxID=13443 RepID=A0A6P6VEG7_COFAR|nr:WAT1-related protein At2g39510 [Coffea arabica]